MRNCVVRFAALGAFASAFVFTGSQAACGDVRTAEWTSPRNGDWTQAENWSTSPLYPHNGSPTPDAAYQVNVSATGLPYQISLKESIALDSLLLSSPDALVSFERGTLTVASLELASGDLLIGAGDSNASGAEAVLKNAHISGSMGELLFAPTGARPVLDAVTLERDLLINSRDVSRFRPVTLRNGLTLSNDVIVRLKDEQTILLIDGSQTIGGIGELHFATGEPYRTGGAIVLNIGSRLTLGPGLAVRATQLQSRIGGPEVFGGVPVNIGLINEGLILADSETDTTLSLMNINVSEGVMFENRGVVQATNNSRIIIGGDWKNTGTFRVADNASLYLGGRFSSSMMGRIERQGGRILIAGHVDNNDQVFVADGTTGDLILGNDGHGVAATPIIDGGRLESRDQAIWNVTATTFRDVTVAADVSVGGSARLTIEGNLVLDEGTVRLSATDTSQGDSNIWFDSPFTPQRLMGTGTIEFLGGRRNTLQAVDLHIEPGIDLVMHRDDVSMYGRNLDNHGSIQVLDQAALYLAAEEFVNHGTLDIYGSLFLGSDVRPKWQNAGTIHVRKDSTFAALGKYSLDDLGTVIDEPGSLITLAGQIDNVGKDLDLESLGFAERVVVNAGTIKGGTLGERALRHVEFVNDVVFDGVTLTSDILPQSTGVQFVVINGLTLRNTTSTFPAKSHVQFGVGQPIHLSGEGTIEVDNSALFGQGLIIDEHVSIVSQSNAVSENRLVFRENRGRVVVDGSSTRLIISDFGLPWTNTGQIELRNGHLELRGQHTTNDLGTILVEGGTLEFLSAWDNTNAEFHIQPSAGAVKFRGEVRGGRIEAATGTVADVGGEFTDVTLSGRATLYDHNNSTDDSALWLRNRFSLDGGELELGPSTRISVVGAVEIAGHGSIVLNAVANSTIIETYTDTILTIGRDVTVRTGAAGGGRISRNGLPVVNYGRISAEHSRRTLVVSGLDNRGVIAASNGGTLRVESSRPDQHGEIYLNGGTVQFTMPSLVNQSDGTIVGHGTIQLFNGTLRNEGTLHPGSTSGELRVLGNVVLPSVSQYVAEINDRMRESMASMLQVSGALTLDGKLSLRFADDFQVRPNEQFRLISATRGIEGEFIGLPEGAVVGTVHDIDLAISYRGGRGNDVILVAGVPEPATHVGMFVGIVVAASRRWRGRHHAAMTA